MAQYRVMIDWSNSASLTSEDNIVNTFYLDTDALPGADDPQGLCDDALQLFRTYRTMPAGFDTIRCRLYNMSDAEPRQPVASAAASFAAGGEAGPREVALCLSYYADTNTPRRRGRMYIGPFVSGDMHERPNTTTQNYLQTLASGISGLGGVNVQWVQYSPTTGQFHNVTNWWVDNEWDTVRSRGLKGTARLQGSVNG